MLLRYILTMLCYAWCFVLPVLVMTHVLPPAEYLAVTWVAALGLGMCLSPEGEEEP